MQDVKEVKSNGKSGSLNKILTKRERGRERESMITDIKIA